MVTGHSRCSSPSVMTGWDEELISWSNFSDQPAPMGMSVHIHNSKASNKTLPNRGVDEAKVPAAARFQGRDWTISARRRIKLFSIPSPEVSASSPHTSEHASPAPPCQSRDSERTPLQPTRILRGSFGSPLAFYPFWPPGLNTHTHPNLGTPQPACHSPGLFTELLKGQDFRDSQE